MCPIDKPGDFLDKKAIQLQQSLHSKPTLQELKEAYPQDWETVNRELAKLINHSNGDAAQAYLKHLSAKAAEKRKGNRREQIDHEVRYRMARLALKQHYVAVASGVESGKVRFNLLNGMIAQKLLFSEGLTRKPVALFWFRLFWPLLWQRRLLMPLVQPEGIYCFYSKQLIAALAKLISGRNCLEIGAGDGTLSSFLNNAGALVVPTDDYSWHHAVKYPEQVLKRDAKDALAEFSPEVVLCSWPPAANNFERQVFRTKSVQMYIVIGSRHRHAAGNWEEYQNQTGFQLEEDRRLSAMVLPPELDSAVYVFRRKVVKD